MYLYGRDTFWNFSNFPFQRAALTDPAWETEDVLTGAFPEKDYISAEFDSLIISQDERMSESPVETIEKALGLHFFSKMGLTCL